VTIHNHPENLKPGPGIRHLKLELPDVEVSGGGGKGGVEGMEGRGDEGRQGRGRR
jgi:hypothetical protein